MDMEEFQYIVDKIEYISNKCAGLKVQNKQLEKKVKRYDLKISVLEYENEKLSSKLTELNHENKRLKEQYQLPNGVHGKIHIKDVNNNE